MRLHENKELFRDAVTLRLRTEGYPRFTLKKITGSHLLSGASSRGLLRNIRFSKVVQRFPSVSPISTGSAKTSIWSLSGMPVCLPIV
jgi:hypothetical protein